MWYVSKIWFIIRQLYWFYLQELFKQYCLKEIKTIFNLKYTETDVLILLNRIKDTFDQLLICRKNKVNIYSLLFYVIYNSYI